MLGNASVSWGLIQEWRTPKGEKKEVRQPQSVRQYDDWHLVAQKYAEGS